MTTTAPPTLEDALLALPADVLAPHERPRFVALRAAARVSTLVGTDARAAARLLANYRPQLAEVGVDFDALNLDGASPMVRRAETARVQASAATVSTIRPSKDGTYLIVKTPWLLRDVMKEQDVGRWHKADGGYRFPATPHGAIAIRDTLGSYGIADPTGRATELLRAGTATNARQAYRSRDDLPPIPRSTYPGWTHQRQAFYFSVDQPARVLDVIMGGGKSKIVTDTMRESGARTVLIACPERVVGVWPNEVRLHNGDAEVHVVDPRRQKKTGAWELLPIAKRIEMYEHALHECHCGLPHYLITNYAASAHSAFAEWSLRQRWDLVVYDEMHRLKAPDGTWTRWAEKMVKVSGARLGGTGTLQPNGPPDIFGQFRALDPGIFGASITAHRARYWETGGKPGTSAEGKVFKRIKPEREAEFLAKVSSITYRADADVLDLPEAVPDVRVSDSMPGPAMSIYKTLERDAYAEILAKLGDDVDVEDAVTAANAAVLYLRLCQFTGGHATGDSGVVTQVHDTKERLLTAELEDMPEREPVVVFCRFRPELDVVERVAAKLGRPYAELSGRRADALNQHSKLDEHAVVAGVQIQAGGVGIDFTRSATAIYYSPGPGLGDYLQSRARLHRPGQTRSVRYRHLVVEGTIDEQVYAALAAKESVVVRIGRQLKALQRAGQL